MTLEALDPFFHYLLYTITVDGSEPLFVLVDGGRFGIGRGDDPDFPVRNAAASGTTLLQSDGAPQRTYERKWPDGERGEVDRIRPGDFFKHVVGMSFLRAVRYAIRVELYDEGDNLLEVLKEVEWSSANPDTERFEPLDINIPGRTD